MSHPLRDQKLRVKHTVTYKAEPLACFSNFPGLDAELTPTQIRALAAAMLLAADDCEKLAEHTRWYGPERREYELEEVVGDQAKIPVPCLTEALTAAGLALSASHNLTVTDRSDLSRQDWPVYVLDNQRELLLVKLAQAALGAGISTDSDPECGRCRTTLSRTNA